MALRARGGRWDYRFMIDGRRYTGATDWAATERNRTRAEMMEHDHRKAILEGRQWSPRLVVRRFSDAAREFLGWAEVEHREHRNTYLRYRTSFVSLTRFFEDVPVGLVDVRRIEQYKAWRLREHRVRDITLRHDLLALSRFFRWAARMNYCRAENPVRLVSVPSDADAVRMRVLTLAEERLYLSQAKGDLRDVALLMLNQGLRPEEAAGLAKADVDLDKGVVHVRRGKSKAARRTLPVTRESQAILARRMEGPSPWIFPSPRKPGRHLFRLNGVHDKACEAAGLRFVLYDLRHTFATRMAEAGVDLATLAAILGHSSLRTVMRYVHPTAEHQREAMLRYDGVRAGRAAVESVQ
jgi:integrase